MKSEHLFPWWAGYLLLNPLRKLVQNPEKVLSDYIRPGMKVLEPGCAMGFFTVPMARMVGNDGMIYAIDIQEKMLKVLKKRLGRMNLLKRVSIRRSSSGSISAGDLSGQIDLAVVYAVFHEVGNRETFIKEVFNTLKPGGRLLFREPGVVSKERVMEEIELIKSAGFRAANDSGFSSKRVFEFLRD